MLWHRDRYFDLILDTRRRILQFPLVLPDVPPKSEMYHEFCEFVRARQAEELPPHRRIDCAKVVVSCGNKAGGVSVEVKVADGDYEYATRKLINLVHEIYLVFLYEGRYYDYLVGTFDLDPDHL